MEHVACPVRASWPRSLLPMAARPLVLAHRGRAVRRRENTVEAFALARELGADGVELDVRRSADGVLIVHHDAESPAVGAARGAAVRRDPRRDCPWSPTLAEALEACAGWLVNVEMKCLAVGGRRRPRARRRAGGGRSRRANATLRVVVSSFDLGTVDAVRAYAPELATGFLVHGSTRRSRPRSRASTATPGCIPTVTPRWPTLEPRCAIAHDARSARRRVDRRRPGRDPRRSPRPGSTRSSRTCPTSRRRR